MTVSASPPATPTAKQNGEKLASRQKRQPPNIYSNTPVIFAAMESTAICVNCTLQPFVYTRDSKKRFTGQKPVKPQRGETEIYYSGLGSCACVPCPYRYAVPKA